MQRSSSDSRDAGVPSYKPKVLVVADRCFWAYHDMQKFLQTELSDRYDIYTDFVIFYQSAPRQSLRERIGRWRFLAKSQGYRRLLPPGETYDVVLLLGFYFQVCSDIAFRTKHLIKCIHTDNFPPPGIDDSDQAITMDEFVAKYLTGAEAVICGTRGIANRFEPYVPKVFTATDSWERRFHRLTPKVKNTGPQFIVGWTGQPKTTFKGYYDFVVPAVQEAAKLRPGIQLKSRFEGPIETLPRFYDDVDVVLIASVGDSGPSLFSEACCCDVPAVANRSGRPAEIIQHEVNGLLVERDVVAMRDALVRLYDDRDLLFSFSQRIRGDLTRVYGAEPMARAWQECLDFVLEAESCRPAANPA
jgi:glycosyltransferase involved in cell wall biosynthesis